jgi:3-hydroxyisobutyrate dehydrogenase
MGNPTSKHLINNGYTVRGYDIDAVAFDRAAAIGVKVAKTIAEAVADADVVYSMLPSGTDVHETLTAADGESANARKGTMVIDCSTIGIGYAKKIHKTADANGIVFVEAPVFGGTEGARDGTLTFMLGCDAKHSSKAKEML